MKWLIPLLFGSFLFTNKNATVHDFHVSRCLFEYNEKAAALQITLHLFIDDVELALEEQGAEKLHLCTKLEAEKAETYLHRYIQQRLHLEIEDKELTINWIGKEIDDDMEGMWCYLEVPNLSTFSSLKIHNLLLLEVFNDQQNIVQIKAGKEDLGQFLLHRQRTEVEVSR